MQAPLLKTKLYIPALRSGWVPRPRLVARLDEGVRACKLTLLSAPAGFGKTTLLCEWIAAHRGCGPQLERRGEVIPTEGARTATLSTGGTTPPLQVAWLSLDAGDNDPTRFWSYLLAALQTVYPGLGGGVQTALHTPQPESPPVEMLLTSLLNELADLPAPLALFLDDLHLVESPQVHEGLVFLLDHLPSAAGPLGGLRVVLSSRADPPWPLARLRARGEMAELRARDLRFTPQEAAAFLNDVAGLGLAAADVTALETRTEGWIAGLQLAALALQGVATRGGRDPSAFVRTFSGSHRLVLDYLVQEVLEQQPAEVQAFLLQTSILERMSAPLCDALRGASGPDAPQDSQEILERLERDNLFVVPLDDERRWYRYHSLFADLLRRRLKVDPERARALHRAASAWFESQGWAAEAISHALAAQDEAYAAALIEAQVPGVLARGEFGQIRPWLEALPEARIRASALLSVARAWAVRESASPETVEVWLRQAEAALPADGAPDVAGVVRGNVAFLRVLNARRYGGTPEAQLALLDQAARVAPESDRAMRSSIATWQGLCYMDGGDEAAAERAFVQAWQIGLAGQGHWSTLVAVYGRTILARWHGELGRAEALCREALAAADTPSDRASPGLAYGSDLYLLLGRILLEWNDLEGAERCLTKGLDGRAPGGVNEIAVLGQFARARLRLAQGQAIEIPDLRRLVPPVVHTLVALAGALEAHLCLMSVARAPSHPQAATWQRRAAQWAASCSLEIGDERWPPGEHWPTIERLVGARVRVAQFRGLAPATGDLHPVLDFLDAQGALLEARGWVELLIQTWIVKAMALSVLGQEADALAALERALSLAAPGGYRRVFLDEGPPMERLLALAVGRGSAAAIPLLAEIQGAAPPQALVDPLSKRELEVLRLLNSELSRTEIAAVLIVSVNTVRSHLKHIYDKLGAHSRQEAVARAYELGLL